MLLKSRSRHSCFLVNFTKFLWQLFKSNNSSQLSGGNSGRTSDIALLNKVFVPKKIWKSIKMFFDYFIKEFQNNFICFTQVKVKKRIQSALLKYVILKIKSPELLSPELPPGYCYGCTGNVSEFTAPRNPQLNRILLRLQSLPIALNSKNSWRPNICCFNHCNCFLILFLSWMTSRKQPPEVFSEKCVLKNFAKQLNICVKVSFLIMLQARPAALLKKRPWQRCFPVNFAKLLRTPFLIEDLRWVLLTGETINTKAEKLKHLTANDKLISRIEYPVEAASGGVL